MSLDKNKFSEVYKRWHVEKQLTGVEVQKLMGLTNSTFYRKIKQYKAQLSADQLECSVNEIK